jgi:hypothetical protein
VLAAQLAFELDLVELFANLFECRSGFCFGVVSAFGSQVEIDFGVAQPFDQALPAADRGFEIGAFLDDLLSSLVVIPEVRRCRRGIQSCDFLLASRDVKDTSRTPRVALPTSGSVPSAVPGPLFLRCPRVNHEGP